MASSQVARDPSVGRTVPSQDPRMRYLVKSKCSKVSRSAPSPSSQDSQSLAIPLNTQPKGTRYLSLSLLKPLSTDLILVFLPGLSLGFFLERKSVKKKYQQGEVYEFLLAPQLSSPLPVLDRLRLLRVPQEVALSLELRLTLRVLSKLRPMARCPYSLGLLDHLHIALHLQHH